jgi:hypothetical protein
MSGKNTGIDCKPSKSYWWPMRAGLRIPARMIGAGLLSLAFIDIWQTGRWDIGRLALPCSFILWSFVPLERRC